MKNLQYYLLLILFSYLPLYGMELPKISSVSVTKNKKKSLLDEIYELENLIYQKEKTPLDNPDDPIENKKIREEINSLKEQLNEKRFLHINEHHMRSIARKNY